MKKIVSLLLALAMVLSCTAAAFAFSDVNDADTAAAAEVLRLMGVIDGYEDGTFRPNRGLSRAEFSKMAVYALGQQDAAAGYRTSTIFPDVKPSSWYAPYVNLCAKNAMIAGFPNGYFMPDSGLTVGQAAAIIIRAMEPALDLTKFPSWPLSYMVEADRIGLLEGTGISPTEKDGNRAISRSEAARMFVAALKNGFGGYKDAGESSISSIDAGTGKVKLSGGTEYDMAKPFTSTTLAATKGTVLLDANGKFVTLLPESTTGSGIVNAAVIVAKNGSTEGFSTLSDGKTYKIYKNGVQIPASEIKKGDVATYSASTGSINLCDTRVSVYYEGCDPNPNDPATITILNGTVFTVLDSAKATLSAYKPGDIITVMLTSSGQIAGVTDLSPNNMAILGADGRASLFLGRNLLATKAESLEHAGELVKLSSYKKDSVSFSEIENSTEDFDPVRRVMGEEPLSSDARIFYNGKETASSELGKYAILGDDISYARRNSDGAIDLLIIPGTKMTTVIYGKSRYDSESRTLSITNGDGTFTHSTVYTVSGNAYVGAKEVTTRIRHFDSEETSVMFTECDTLAQLRNVSKTAFSGKTMVTFGGKSYSIPGDVQCYNADSQSWVSFDDAMVYSDTYTLYASEDSVIRIIEVKR
ncbi:MAG: S-layer homology domain-containing protein [Firmicutes bacterium]|nr:S-layer homology domain-containing protein [Bacillota bacterium]